MPDRPTSLIVIVNGDDVRILSAHHANNAQPVYDNLSALVAAAGARMHILEVPETEGFVSHQEPLQLAPKSAIRPEPEPLPAVPSAKFKSRKARQNENGEFVIQKFADGSELISSSEPPGEEAFS